MRSIPRAHTTNIYFLIYGQSVTQGLTLHLRVFAGKHPSPVDTAVVCIVIRL